MSNRWNRWLWLASGTTLACGIALLSGCATVPPDTPVLPAEQAEQQALKQAWAGGGAAAPGWMAQVFPGKTPSRYRFVQVDARSAVNATADSAMSVWRRSLRVEPSELRPLQFSWKVPALIETADLAVREHDDSPARIVLAFDGDRDRFSAGDRALSDLSRLLTGEEMPYATLMYVWCNKRPPGTVVVNPRTPRVRSIVVESGPANLNQWRQYHRDIRADFIHAFGEEPQALIGMGLMTDSDNTRSRAEAWYGPISFDDVAREPFVVPLSQ